MESLHSWKKNHFAFLKNSPYLLNDPHIYVCDYWEKIVMNNLKNTSMKVHHMVSGPYLV